VQQQKLLPEVETSLVADTEAQIVIDLTAVENRQRAPPNSNKPLRLHYWQEPLKHSEYGKSLEDGEVQRASEF